MFASLVSVHAWYCRLPVPPGSVLSVFWWAQDEQAQRANAQQQLQECGRTVRALSAQLQKADTAAAERVQVSCAYSC